MTLTETQNAVLFSMPGTRDFRLLHQHDFGALDDMPPNEASFIVRPFASGSPVYLRADVESPVDIHAIVFDPGPCQTQANASDEQEYLQLVNEAIAHCRKLNGKVVLSRVQDIPVEHKTWQNCLEGLRKTFPQAFVYLLHTEKYGTWMGATPETLVQSDGTTFQTDALAGTKWGEEAFTQKEFEEQAVVTQTIVSRLQAVEPITSERSEVQYGNSLRHLLTRIHWESEQSIVNFAEQLHPTPAVCGVPAQDAYEYILKHEPYDRLLYTGFLGKVNPHESSHLFVNLRCMQLFRDRIRIFVGGGINALSDPFSEWEETERKKNAVLRAMNINGGDI